MSEYIELPNYPKCGKSANVNAKDETHPTRFRCNHCQQNFNEGDTIKSLSSERVQQQVNLSKRPSLLKKVAKRPL